MGENLYRAKLDRSNRLLFSIRRYQKEAYALILEYIANHAYEKSRFLRCGALVHESKVAAVRSLEAAQTEPLVYVNPELPSFDLLVKIISFDQALAVSASPTTPYSAHRKVGSIAGA